MGYCYSKCVHGWDTWVRRLLLSNQYVQIRPAFLHHQLKMVIGYVYYSCMFRCSMTIYFVMFVLNFGRMGVIISNSVFFSINYRNPMIHFCVKDQPLFLHVKLSGCCPSLWQFQLVLCEFQKSSSQRRQWLWQRGLYSISPLVPIYRANKSKLPRMKHRRRWIHVCSHVTGNGSPWVSQVTLKESLSQPWPLRPSPVTWKNSIIRWSISWHHLKQ